MKKKGRAVLELKSSVATHLAGSALTIPDVPPSFSTCAVTYSIVGGIESQDRVFKCINEVTAHLPVLEPAEPSAVSLLPSKMRKQWSQSVTLKNYNEYTKVPATDSEHQLSSHPQSDTRPTSPSPIESGYNHHVPIHPPALQKASSAPLSQLPQAIRQSTRLAPSTECPTTRQAATRTSTGTQDQPDSAATMFVFQCRCGRKGQDADVKGGRLQHKMGAAHLGGLIQCNQCLRWMHIACQRRGRADKLREDVKFSCNWCGYLMSNFNQTRRGLKNSSFPANQLQKDEKKKSGTTETKAKKLPRLKDRLLAGAFALVQLGVSWYPVCIIRTPLESEPDEYTIHIWEGCDKYVDPEALERLRYVALRVYIAPGVVLRDAMRCDQQARRGMPLGRWTNARIPEEIHYKKVTKDNWDHFIAGGFSDEGNYYLPDAELKRILTTGPRYVIYPQEDSQPTKIAAVPSAPASPTYDSGESEVELRDSSEPEETNLQNARPKPRLRRGATRQSKTG
ncbi:hypothetical protein BDV98DRAFT_608405 [Pterulicium gracile]|uniref:Uncharacterized protein n=1 Tax=Pterulicium gracile TaxID=1884261 RepID=A0A5C3Q594_9AGAR|nr:hypothetical protein BDV98DRAFT_608405 [Pterula gracilis]